MELKILIKNTAHLASIRIVKFFFGLVRAKLNAHFLGTTGMGVMSQITQTTALFSNFTLLGMNDGVVKQASSRKDAENFRQQLLNILKNYFIVVSISMILIIGVSLIFSEKLTVYFFGNIIYYKYYLISIVTFPILILNSISFALLKTFKNIKKIASAELFTTLISFVVFVPLIYFYQLMGAVISLVITFILQLVFNHLQSKKEVLNKYKISYSKVFSEGKIVNRDLKELLMFAGYGLSIGVYQMICEFVARIIVIKELGIDKLGLYAPNQAWSGYFTGLMLPSIYTYLYPRFSEAKHDSEVNGVLNDVFRLVSFSMVPFIFIGIGFRTIIIPLFYSNEFIGAADYLPGHFFGSLFAMWMASFTQAFTPTGRIKIYVFFLFIIHTIDVALIYILVPKIGLYAYMLQFMVTPILFFFVFYLYLHKAIGFSFSRSNIQIMSFIVFTSIILYFVTENYSALGYILAVLLMFSSWMFLKLSEKEQIINKINAILKLGNKTK